MSETMTRRERVDYVKCAIENLVGPYETCKAAAKMQREAEDEAGHERALMLCYTFMANTFGDQIGDAFPWLKPSGDEVAQAVQEIVAEMVGEGC